MTAALNPRQTRFVAEYLKEPNATQAALKAGYSAKTAASIGSENLKKPEIAAAIAAYRDKLAEKFDLSVDRIVGELAKLGFSNMADYMDIGPDGLPRLNWANLTRDQAAALTEVTVEAVGDIKVGSIDGEDLIAPVRKVKFKLADKRGALVDLLRHLGADAPPRNQPPSSPSDVLATPQERAAAVVKEIEEMFGRVARRPTVIDGKAIKVNGGDDRDE